MKFRLFLLFVFLAPFVLSAQTKSKPAAQPSAPKLTLLDAKDPLVGEWEWIASDTGAPAAPLPDQDWRILRFAAGTTQSMGALSFDNDKGYSCPTYFLAFGNGKQITATISDSCIPEDKGKKITFSYTIDSATGELLVTVRGNTFHYKRRLS